MRDVVDAAVCLEIAAVSSGAETTSTCCAVRLQSRSRPGTWGGNLFFNKAARQALRARQGGGARYDAKEAPAEDLLLARRATAFFARKLNELDDAALYLPALGPAGRTRAHVAAVGYDARRLALALEPLCPADGAPPPEAVPDSLPTLDLAVTLPAHALRHLFDHSAILLDVCWRDLPGKAWDGNHH